MKFDPEEFESSFIAMFQDKLAAKLSEIETEKGDGVSLPDFTDRQYIDSFQSRVLNESQFFYYKTEIETPETRGRFIQQQITMSCGAFFIEENWTVAKKKIFRYTRAITEVALKHKDSRISDLQAQTFAPIELQLNANSAFMKAGIVELTGSIVI